MYRILLFVLTLSFFTTSCSSTKKYGYKNERISKSRNKNSRAADYSISKKRTETKNGTARKKISKSRVKRSSTRSNIVSYASKYKGVEYNYGGKSPKQGFDCSGFVTYVYQKNGKPIRGASRDLAKMGRRKKLNDLEKGDLLFFGSKGRVKHVGMVYSNDGQDLKMIHSSSSKGIVIVSIAHSDYWNSRFLFARDLLQSSI